MRWRISLVAFICASLYCIAAFPQSNLIGGGIYGDAKISGGNCPSLATVTVPSGLLFWAPLDTCVTSGITTNDLSGNSLNATLENAPTQVAGQIQQGFSLDGSTQYIQAPSGIAPAAITVTAWVKYAALGNAYNAIVQSGNGSLYYEYFVKSDGKLALDVRGPSGGTDYDDTGSHTLTTGTWYFVALSYGPSNNLTGYVNASVDGGVTYTGALSTTVSQPFCIGNDCVTGGRLSNAIFDDIRVYNRELLGTEITSIYNAGLLHNP